MTTTTTTTTSANTESMNELRAILTNINTVVIDSATGQAFNKHYSIPRKLFDRDDYKVMRKLANDCCAYIATVKDIMNMTASELNVLINYFDSIQLLIAKNAECVNDVKAWLKKHVRPYMLTLGKLKYDYTNGGHDVVTTTASAIINIVALDMCEQLNGRPRKESVKVNPNVTNELSRIAERERKERERDEKRIARELAKAEREKAKAEKAEKAKAEKAKAEKAKAEKATA